MLYRIVIAVVCAAATLSPAGAQTPEAGYQHIVIGDGTEVGVWYPAQGTPVHQRLGLGAQDVVIASAPPKGRFPLVVISHGTGGDFAGHVDTAIALARAGFIVAALTHPGDNWRDSSGATHIEDRPQALSRLITFMLGTWPSHAAINPERIGAFGFSAGGFTILAAAGGRPDMTKIASHCVAHPDFFDCRLLKTHPRTTEVAWPDLRDSRIKALVVAAPALGFTFSRTGLADVNVPVQLWRADDDHILPAPEYADAVRAALPLTPEFHSVPGAGHFDFLAPCVDPSMMPQICTSGSGFDRAAFHARFNADVVRFFRSKLNS